MNKTIKKLVIHVIYSHRQREQANKWLESLRKDGWQFELAPLGFEVGSIEWKNEVKQSILKADVAIAILSPNAIEDPMVEWRAQTVIDQGKLLIPVVLEKDFEPPRSGIFSRLQYIYGDERGKKFMQESLFRATNMQISKRSTIRNILSDPLLNQETEKTKSPVEILVAKYGFFGMLAAALIGVLGTCITAYFGYISVRAQIDTPISATQTAESRLNISTSTADISATAIPTSHIWFTPYQDSFIEIISLVPNPTQALNATEDIPYSYKVRYFVPEFNWQGSGIEPRIQLERVISDTSGLETVVLNDIVAKIGVVTTIDIEGRFIVPSDRDIWDLRIKVIFLTSDGGATSGGNLVLPIQYAIKRSLP